MDAHVSNTQLHYLLLHYHVPITYLPFPHPSPILPGENFNRSYEQTSLWDT